jgi:outer membrane receptor for ferrienterochelin and colicin
MQEVNMAKEVRSLLLNFSKFCLIVIIFIYLGISLQAQENNNEDLANPFKMSLDELLNAKVSGVSKYEQWQDDAPASVMVITKKQIRDRGYEDLSDLLKDVPGIDIIENAGRFGEYYTIRGIEGNDRFLVLINGHKINPTSGTFFSIGNSVSLQFAKQVEIIYGPASSIYGADAFAGIINIILDDNDKTSTRIRVSGGSSNRKNLSIFAHYKGKRGFTLTAAARRFLSDGPDFTGKGYPEYDAIVAQYQSPQRPHFQQPIDDHNIFLQAGFKNISFLYFRQHFNEGNGLGLNPDFYVFNQENRWKMTTDLLWGIYKKKFIDDSLLTFDLSYISHAQHRESQFLKWLIPGNPVETFNQYMTGNDKSLRMVLSYNKTFSRKFKLIAGIEYETTKSIPPYANDEVLGNSFKYEGQNAKIIADALSIKEQRYAGFGQLTYSPSLWLDIILGGRFDYSSRYKGTFNPRVGLILKPIPKTTVKMLYGTAFQAPSLFYQFEQFGTPIYAFRSTNEINTQEDPGWSLKNQLLTTHELSIHRRFGDHFRFGVSIYYNNMKDLIERVTYDSTGSTWNKYFNMFTDGQRNENIGSRKSVGLNFTLNAAINENLDGYFYYSYTVADQKELVDRVETPRVAHNKIWIGATFRKLFRFLTLSPRFKWIGKSHTAITSSLYTGESFFDHSSLDISIRAAVLKKIHLLGFLGNILDHRYEVGGLFEQNGVYAASIPQPRFHFRLGIEAEF